MVDDEPLIADTLAEILTNAGFDAVRFYDSRLALSEAERRCPDILLTDVVMPYLDGIELATSVVKRCPTARVLLLSGYTAGADLVEPAWHKGKRFELLSKPLDPRVLLRKLAA